MIKITDKDKLAEVCEAEFSVFTTAIGKMGFDGPGFAFMVLAEGSSLRSGWGDHLSKEEWIAVEHRIELFT